jgi:predicted phosphodiesterase
MLDRVAVLSDIHGALPALEAVLAEPDVAAADLIVLTGDIAAGPQPVEVLDTLVGLGDRVLLVRGNADRELVALARGLDAVVPDRPVDPLGGRNKVARGIVEPVVRIHRR